MASRASNLVMTGLRAWPFVLPALMLSSVYPGILYTDSFIRWSAAMGSYVLPQHPIVPGILMGISWRLTGEFGGWALGQAVLTMAAIVLFMRNYLGFPGATYASVILYSFPVVAMYSVFHSHDSAAGAFVLIAVSSYLSGGERNQSLAIVFLLAASVFRSPTALAFLPLVLLEISRRSWSKAAALLVLTIVCAVVSAKQNSLLANAHYGQTGVSFLWDEMHISSLDEAGICGLPHFPPDRPDLQGDFSRGVERVDSHSMYSIGGESLGIYDWARSSEGDVASAEGLISMWMKCPRTALSAKLYKALSIMGFTRPLEDAEIFRFDHLETMTKSFGYRDTNVSRAIVDIYKGTMDLLDFLRRPWVIFLAAMFVAASVARRRKDGRLVWATACSISVYLPYLLISQNHEFRYFFPSFLVCIAVIVAGLAKLFVEGDDVGL